MAGPARHSSGALSRRGTFLLAKKADRVTGNDLPSCGESCQPRERKTLTTVAQALKPFAMRGAQGWSRLTALVSAGSSTIAIGTHNVIAVILLAALSCVSVIAACITAVLESWNRDTDIIDARTRAKSLRRWARKARTPEERERAARVALAPIILSSDSPSRSESLQDLLLPRVMPGDQAMASKLRRSAASPTIQMGRESEHKRSS